MHDRPQICPDPSPRDFKRLRGHRIILRCPKLVVPKFLTMKTFMWRCVRVPEGPSKREESSTCNLVALEFVGRASLVQMPTPDLVEHGIDACIERETTTSASVWRFIPTDLVCQLRAAKTKMPPMLRTIEFQTKVGSVNNLSAGVQTDLLSSSWAFISPTAPI